MAAQAEDHGGDHVSLRAFVERIIEERSRLHESEVRALKELLQSSFMSQKEAVNAAAESLREYKAQSNEFRAQLKDQAASFPTRIEMQTALDGVSRELTNFRSSQKGIDDSIRTDISALQNSRSNLAGISQSRSENRQQDNWKTGIIVAIVLGLLSAMLGIASIILKKGP
jgi:hypothetical protein